LETPREQAFQFSTWLANHCVLGHNKDPQDLKSVTQTVSNDKTKAPGNNNGAGRISSNDAEIREHKNANIGDADKKWPSDLTCFWWRNDKRNKNCH